MDFFDKLFTEVADFLETTFSHNDNSEDMDEGPYIGQIFIHNVCDVRENLFNSKEKPNKVYDFLEKTIPLHVNYNVDTKLGFLTLKKKVDRVGNYYYDNKMTLKEHFDISNLNNLCKLVFTKEQEEQYQKLIKYN